MAFTTLNLGLELTIPTSGTVNWGTTLFNTTWTKLSEHGHTGSGDGSLITHESLGPNYGYTIGGTLTPAGTTQTVNFATGNIQTVDLGSASGDVTLTFTNPKTGAIYWLFFIQGAVVRDVIFPATVKWPQGQKIILSTADNAKDYAEFLFDGTDFNGLKWDQGIS